MEWKGQADWQASPEVDWQIMGSHAGSFKAAGALSFVKVAAAGHMVPMDQPYNALAMITAFTRGQKFNAMDAKLPPGGSGASAQEQLLRYLASSPVPEREPAATSTKDPKAGKGTLPRDLNLRDGRAKINSVV